MADFQLLSSDKSIRAHGVRRALSRGPITTLAARVAAFFATHQDGPSVLAGALPFDRGADDYLLQPASIETGPRPQALPAGKRRQGARWIVTPEPSAEHYAEAVAKALATIAAKTDGPALSKIVLSRSLHVQADVPLDADALLARLAADASVAAFSLRLPRKRDVQPVLIGATPELLVSRAGETVLSHPLAGSSRRYADRQADRQSAAALENSDKDRREHKAVVEAISDTLGPYCRELSAPDGTRLRATATMWHLGTRIVGRLKDPGTPVAELLAALHPTPAVCGLPREPAAALLPHLEGYDREFYAGAVGWLDAQGDGEWYVTLRCAQLSGSQARLYAGAGIVAGSDPLAEVDETSAKFLAMLNALGVDEHGRPLGDAA